MSSVVGIILICLAIIIFIGMALQVQSYCRGRQLISRRQLVLRITSGLLLLLTIAMMFYVGFNRFTNPLHAMLFLSVLVVLPVVVFVLAWLDLRIVHREKHLRQAELYMKLALLQEEIAKKQSKDE